jgi:hypothetical protein
MGYGELSANTKQQIFPLFELSQRNNTGDLTNTETSLRRISGQQSFLLDLCHDAAPPPYIPNDPEPDRVRIERELEVQRSYNTILRDLLMPDEGFEAWRKKAASYPNAVPVLQFTDAANQSRAILRQGALLAAGGNSIAIRVRQDNAADLIETIGSLISILDSPSQLLIVVDCGQRRTGISERAGFARETIAGILNLLDVVERPLVRAVCMSNSFTQSSHNGLRDYENHDWRLWREARDSFPFLFGDYAAIQRRQRSNTFVPPDFRASLALSLDEIWLYYRDQNANDREGWVNGAAEIVARPEFAMAPDCWGKRLISRAAGSDIEGIDSARFWYAAKVNTHLTRHAVYAAANISDYEGGE